MMIFVPSWWWRQWRKTSIALMPILARLALPAVPPRLVAPLLAMVAAVPASSTLAASATDFGFRKSLIGSNSGVRAEISTYPAHLLAIL